MGVWRATIAALALLLAAPGALAGDTVVISTGRERGSYYYIGERLKTQLILKDLPVPVVVTSQGSLDNLGRLADASNRVNVALTQADALHSYLEAHPEFRDRFFVLGDMGRECALLVSRRKGGWTSAADLKREGAGRLSVDAPGSGAAVTFEILSSLEPAFHATEAVDVPIMEALLQLKEASGFSTLRGVLLVQRPTQVTPALRIILDGEDVYAPVPFTPGDVPQASLPDGSPVYSFGTVEFGGEGGKRTEVRTFCTRALLLASREKLDRAARDKLSQVMLEVRDQVVGKE